MKDENKMKFTDLKCCPFCGCSEYYEKQRVYGISYFMMRYDGEEANNDGMYDGMGVFTVPNATGISGTIGKEQLVSKL